MSHPSTASVPITVLLYNGPLLCCFNVPIKGLNVTKATFWLIMSFELFILDLGAGAGKTRTGNSSLTYTAVQPTAMRMRA